MVLPMMVAPASRIRRTAAAEEVAGVAAASQSGLPPPVRWPAMSYMSLTAQVRPASGPVPAPETGASRSCGTKAERGWEESGIIAPELALLTFAAIHEHRS